MRGRIRNLLVQNTIMTTSTPTPCEIVNHFASVKGDSLQKSLGLLREDVYLSKLSITTVISGLAIRSQVVGWADSLIKITHGLFLLSMGR